MFPSHHLLTVGRVERGFPVVEIAPGLALAALDIPGDTELVEEAAQVLTARLEASPSRSWRHPRRRVFLSPTPSRVSSAAPTSSFTSRYAST